MASCSTTSPWTTGSPYQTTYAYDSLGDLVSETRPASTAAPSGATTSYTYDPAGDVLTSTDPNGVTTTNTYTPTGLVATTSYSDGTHGVTDTYDASGNLVSRIDASGTTTRTYDPFGELTSETNGAGQTVAYAYDTQGNVTAITYPLPSSATWAQSDTVTYAYDPAGNLTQVSDFNNNPVMVTNDTSGNADNLVLGSPTYANTASNDAVTTFESQTGSPQRIELSNYGTSLASFSYSDAPAGNVLKETDTPTSPSSPASYTYDAQSRVTGETPGTGTASAYGFDPSGNLTTLPSGATGTYNDASELTSSSLSGTATSYTYDANGNRTGSSAGGTATSSATWNGAGQLTSYSNAAGKISSAVYSGNGLRQSVLTGTASTSEDFTWDTVGSIPQLLMDATFAYLYAGANAPIEQVNLSTGDLSYLVTDALGSVRDVVSSSGSITASTSYGAWGTPSTSGGVTSATPFGFAGGYTDPTGLVYLINRYYDPGSGQFLSVDPLVDVTGEPYGYGGGDPVSGIDPMGLAWWNPCDWGNVCHHAHNVANGVRHRIAATATVVAHGTASAARWVYHHPAEAGGIALGVVSVATGVGAVADVVASPAVLGITSAITGTVGSTVDASACFDGTTSSGLACTGFALNLTGAVVGGAGTVVDIGVIGGAEGVSRTLGSVGAAVGSAGLGVDAYGISTVGPTESAPTMSTPVMQSQAASNASGSELNKLSICS